MCIKNTVVPLKLCSLLLIYILLILGYYCRQRGQTHDVTLQGYDDVDPAITVWFGFQPVPRRHCIHDKETADPLCHIDAWSKP